MVWVHIVRVSLEKYMLLMSDEEFLGLILNQVG